MSNYGGCKLAHVSVVISCVSREDLYWVLFFLGVGLCLCVCVCFFLGVGGEGWELPFGVVHLASEVEQTKR